MSVSSSMSLNDRVKMFQNRSRRGTGAAGGRRSSLHPSAIVNSCLYPLWYTRHTHTFSSPELSLQSTLRTRRTFSHYSVPQVASTYSLSSLHLPSFPPTP